MTDIISGIYEICNLTNGHRYIGSAVNINRRWGQHTSNLRNNKHHSSYLQNAWNKYSESCFVFSIIESCPRDNLIEREQFYIDTFSPAYNACPTAGNQLGVRRSPLTLSRMRAAKKGTKPSLEASIKGCARAAEVNRGKQRSEITKSKISKANQNPSEETRRKRGEGNKGKTISPEQRAIISAAHKGKKLSAEHRAKISAANFLRWGKRKANDNPDQH